MKTVALYVGVFLACLYVVAVIDSIFAAKRGELVDVTVSGYVGFPVSVCLLIYGITQ